MAITNIIVNNIAKTNDVNVFTKSQSIETNGAGDYPLTIVSRLDNFASIQIKGGINVPLGQTALIGQYDDGKMFLFNQANRPLSFFTGGAERMQVRESGNIIIATNVDNLIDKLQVNGNIQTNALLKVGQYTTATRPSYVKGAQFFDTTINKLVIGGATSWEVVTSI